MLDFNADIAWWNHEHRHSEVRSLADTFADAAQAMKSGVGHAQARIEFASPELLWQVLTAKRWELLKAMCGAGPVSIREAARRVERDVAAGVLNRTAQGQIEFPFDSVKFEFMLQAA
jgi:predicted transcriptional regulator